MSHRRIGRPSLAAIVVAIAFSPIGAVARAGDASAVPKPPKVRVIRVCLACDEEYRRNAAARSMDWKADAAERVRKASAPFEREFGIRWMPFECIEWTSPDDAATLNDLRLQLARDVAPCGADVVVALTGQTAASGSTKDYAFWGYSEYFGRHAIVTALRPDAAAPFENHTLAHEFGHLLGAWHCVDAATVMTPRSSDLTRFDAQARRVLAIVRNFDFRRGVDGLDDATVRAIDDIWREGHAPDGDQPVAAAYMLRGWTRVESRDFDGAASDFGRAVAMWESCAGKDAPGLVACLVGLARVSSERTPRDARRELEYALRANRIAVATKLREDPIASSFVHLARAQWANGRDEEAVDAYRQALAIRQATLGPEDALTEQARNGLRFFASRGSESAAQALREVSAAAGGAGGKSPSTSGK